MGNGESFKPGDGTEEIIKKAIFFQNQFKENTQRLSKMQQEIQNLIKKIHNLSTFNLQIDGLKDQIRNLQQGNTKIAMQYSYLNSKRKSVQQTLRQMQKLFTEKYSELLKSISHNQKLLQKRIYSNWKKILRQTKKTIIMLILIGIMIIGLYFFLEKYGDNQREQNSRLIKIIVVVVATLFIFTMIYLRRQFWVNLTKLWKYFSSIFKLFTQFFN